MSLLYCQAFTLFDEARCRGADLQLRPDAVGLLTLGPTTCKDKLMQAAGGGRVGMCFHRQSQDQLSKGA